MKLRATALILTLTLGLLAAPLPAEAQKGKVYRIGRIFTGSCDSPIFPVYHRALVEGLRERGWIEGRNVAIDYRCAEGHLDRLPKIAAELAQLNVDVLIVVGSPAVRAARQASTTIPIVFFTADPVAEGLVTSLAKPGGNATGVAVQPTPKLSAKRLQLLKEAVPAAARMGVLYERPSGGPDRPELLRLAIARLLGAARVLGVELQFFEAAQPPEIERAFTAMLQERVEALYVAAVPVYFSHRKQIAELAAKHRLPAMYPARDFVQVGGLMSYHANFLHMMQRVGVYAGKILDGADPATLPIEQPTKFELWVNLKTAKALGLTIPPSVLVRADRVIE